MDGVSSEQLADILGEPVEHLQQIGGAPAWLDEFVAAYTRAMSMSADLEPALSDATDEVFEEDEGEGAGPTEQLYDFLELIRPLIDQACDRLDAGIGGLIEQGYTLPFDPDMIDDILLVNIPGPLLMRISRTLVLELHVARLQGHLQGETPQARFQSFIARLRRPEVAIAILAEYPVFGAPTGTLSRPLDHGLSRVPGSPV